MKTPAADFSRHVTEDSEVKSLRWERNVAALFALLATLAASVSAMNAYAAEAKMKRLREQPVRAACAFINPVQ
jgi:hypothetical protein